MPVGSEAAYEFPALRKGETERHCEKCGRAYQPTSRTQRFCPDCGRPRPYTSETVARRKPGAMKEAERFMDANLKGLNDALFRQLDRIESADTPEKLESETSRANSVCKIAETIIGNGRLVLEASKASMTTAESVQVPKMLLGNGK